MFGLFRKQRIEKLLKSGEPRRIRVHSVAKHPADAPRPDYLRVAFEFLDPPGPWTMQFFEAEPSPEAAAELSPGAAATFYESEDGARTRILVTESGARLLPR